MTEAREKLDHMKGLKEEIMAMPLLKRGAMMGDFLDAVCEWAETVTDEVEEVR